MTEPIQPNQTSDESKSRGSKQGLKRAVLGLVLGVAIGLGITSGKSFLISSLIGVLQDELDKSCNPDERCRIVYDKADLSLLGQSASVYNISIRRGKEVALSFNEIKAQFSLRNLWSKRMISLTHLHLIGGKANGFDDDSVTFRFIDTLTEPPINPDPDRYRLRLEQLSVYDTSGINKFPSSTLSIKGVGLHMSRNNADDFVLHHNAQSLELSIDRKDSAPSLFKLGAIAGTITLPRGLAVFEKLKLSDGINVFTAVAESKSHQGNILTGSGNLTLSDEYLKLSSWLSTTLSSSGNFAGTLGNPNYSGNFSATSPSMIHAGDMPLLNLESLQGNIYFDLNRGQQQLRVSDLIGVGNGITLSQKEPLRIDDDRLSGIFEVSAQEFTIGPFKLENLRISASPSGTVDDSRLAIAGDIGNLYIAAIPVGAASFTFAQVAESDWRLAVAGSKQDPHRLQGSSVIRFSESDSEFIEPFKVSLSELPIWFQSENNSSFMGSIKATGTVVASGKLTAKDIRVDANLSVTNHYLHDDFAYRGTLSLNQGKLLTKLNSESLTNNITVNSDLLSENPRVTVEIAVTDLPKELFEFDKNCGSLNFHSTYQFDPKSPLNGDGAVEVSKASFGCEPFALNLARPTELKIHKGALNLSQLTLNGNESSVTLGGTISIEKGFAASAEGTVNLSSFLPYTPIDNLDGSLTASAIISGPLSSPILDGSAKITNGKLEVESLDLSLYNITGTLALDGSRIAISECKGAANQGTFALSGFWDLVAPNSSELDIALSTIEIEPAADASLTLDGNLRLRPDPQHAAKLAGEIAVKSGVIERTLNLQTIVKELLTSTFFDTTKTKESTKSASGIEVDVKVTASRNVFIDSNLVNAELRADLTVAGDANNPTVIGELDVLSGWFAIKDTRFDITSGNLSVNSASGSVVLDVLGEALFYDQQGGTVTVLAEAKGPITDLKVNFTSDDDRNQQELLTMLTSAQQINAISSSAFASSSYSPSDSSEESGFDFLSVLTRIDSLAIEPTFNDATGLIEPSLVAEKRLFDDFSLRAQSFVGSSVGGNTFQARYALSDRLTLIGSVNTALAEQKTSLGGDVLITLFERRLRYLTLTLEGNETLSKKAVLGALRISEDSRIPLTDIAGVADALQLYYQEKGFYDAKAFATCHRGEKYCRDLSLGISEGTRSKLTNVRFEGDSLPSEIDASEVTAITEKSFATKRNSIRRANSLINILRNQGYIGARAWGRYEVNSNMPSSERVLVITVLPGEPVTFEFPKNLAFSEAEFLNTINLFGRKQPFGKNTINLLVQNIEEMYQEAGYLYTTISYKKFTDPVTKRTRFTIQVHDEEKIPVTKVELLNIDDSLRIQLLTDIEDNLGSEADTLLSPEVARRDEIQKNAKILEAIIADAGYPECRVKGSIVADDPGVRINYDISLGEAFKPCTISVNGLPPDIGANKSKRAKSIPEINAFIESLQQELTQSGYRSPIIQTSLDSDSEQILVEVDPGTLTTINAITYSGNLKTKKQILRQHVSIKPGDPWNTQTLAEARRKLLTLGLFSEVTLEPSDGTLDSSLEDLVVRVTEKPHLSLQLGGGLDSQLGAHLVAVGTDKSLFADGRTISLTIDTYYNQTNDIISQGTATLRFLDPIVFDTGLRFISDARYQKRNLVTLPYDLNRALISNQFNFDLPLNLTASVGHSLVHDDIEEVVPAAQLSDLDDGSVRLSFLDSTVTYDRRDNPLSPRNGFFLSARTRWAAQPLYSEADFWSISGRASFITPIVTPRFSVGNNTRLATTLSYGDTSEIPITQRYFTGGRTSVRGFRDNSLGPTTTTGIPIGGDLLFVNNLEFSYEVIERVSLLQFWDSGTTYLRDNGVSLSDLRHSAGIGVRYQSPIGPIGLDFGHPLDQREGEPSWRIHFNVGSTF